MEPPVSSTGELVELAELDCWARLTRVRPSLTGARAKVADTISADPWAARGASILVLAELAGVSENAITRFTHALGYKGYREFSQALALDLGKSVGLYHSHPVDLELDGDSDDSGTLSLVRRVMAMEVECMQDTLANLSEGALDHVVTRLAEAPSVLLLGTGTAAPLCQMLTYRLASVGIDASWTSDPMVMLAQITRLKQGDLAMGISYSGRSRDTVQGLAYARGKGIETAALTAEPNSPVASVVDTLLTVFSPAVSPGAAQFSARVAGLALLEAIATAVSERRGPEAIRELNQLGASHSELNDLPTDWTFLP